MRLPDLFPLYESETAVSPLPDEVIRAFEELGSMQRGKPEMAMLRVQQIMGGGVLSPVVEHVGDITHRMSHMVRYGTVLGRDKIEKTFGWLTHRYGFRREMAENIRNNARYRGIDAEEMKEQLATALQAYAAAHARLPVYNLAQWLARQAAIDVGLQKFEAAAECLARLKAMAPDEEEFALHAIEYHLDDQGRPMPYKP